MKEVAYTQAERDEVSRKMQLFAMEAILFLAKEKVRRRHAIGNTDEPIELEGSIDGVDYLVWLGPEGSRHEDIVLVDNLEE